MATAAIAQGEQRDPGPPATLGRRAKQPRRRASARAPALLESDNRSHAGTSAEAHQRGRERKSRPTAVAGSRRQLTDSYGSAGVGGGIDRTGLATRGGIRGDERNVAKAIARGEAARGSKRSPPADSTRAFEIGLIVRRGGDRIPGTPPRARNPRVGGSDAASGSECADRGFGVPNANSSRAYQIPSQAAAGVERKCI
jgi:hypothetical protein